MAQFSGIAFGPGFADAGTPLAFEADAGGVRAATANADDGSQRWPAITLGKAGWDGTQLRLEWKGAAGAYALSVADAAAVQAIAVLAGNRAVKAAGSGGATRAWSWGLIVTTVVLPLLLLVALLSQHERIAGWIVDRISVEQEHKFGARMFERHKAGLKLIEGPALAMVRETGARLTQGSPYQYEFYVADDKSVNAYAMPGGFVVMHSGLLALADSADEVAGVLAHEVSHVEKRHSLTGMAKTAGLYATVSLLIGDFGSLASAGANLLNLKFSRDHEREADSEGLRLLVKAGLQPEPMAGFFRKMAKQGGGVPAFLSTHPASEERFAAIESAVKLLPEAARAAAPLNVDYAKIKAALPAK
jgi:predicted Zn-dependent protease